jgi:hypothetical protein
MLEEVMQENTSEAEETIVLPEAVVAPKMEHI